LKTYPEGINCRQENLKGRAEIRGFDASFGVYWTRFGGLGKKIGCE
jgi:hypothetical protein